MENKIESRMGSRIKRRKKKRKKNTYILGIISVLIILASAMSGYITYHYSKIKYWNNLIYPGVAIEGVNLSGKTKEQAGMIIKQMYSDKTANNKINIIAIDKKYTIDYSKISPKYNLNEVIDQAYSYGKNFNLFHKYIAIKSPKPMNYKLKFSFDTDLIKSTINKIEEDTNKAPVNAYLEANDEKINIVPEQNGTKLQKEKLEKDILAQITAGMLNNVEVKASMQISEPKIKGSMLKSVNSIIGEFSTSFGGISSSERANNITIAANTINGTVLLPGEIFSFNDVVGERTEDKGYEAAPVIVNNKLESGLGGGICQVSSTLYNAVNNAGLPSIERMNHTLPVHYVPTGMDATVDFGNIDYKFQNTLDYPIYIEADAAGGIITFNLYSNSTERN